MARHDTVITPEVLQGFMADEAPPLETCEAAISMALALIEAYTRGGHVDRYGNPLAGISSVTLSAAARIAANPGQVSRRDQAGTFSTHRGVGFSGFNLGELAVLNRYRKRAIG